ncbi:SBP (S-ribonuclease binding protein) family protein [Rhynchospora pubera]|uniref:SBP (S-ribonuclease binding protein) family protein n=1 Tax=Rhynchospora pubera TaxID=906938 RepID=A0AAV8HX78_9POAL|nr:SBP (S-ribonuclease binding protein) family protein [Rhynchospora pubera]
MAFFQQHNLQGQQQQQQNATQFRNFVPIDGQISGPIPFFNSAYQDQSQPPLLVDAMGLAPVSIGMGSNLAADAASNGWGRRPKEQEFLENSQITSIDFLQTGGSAVSTGLALSLDDRRAASSSGESPLLLLPMVDEEIACEVQRMDAEMDRFIRTQSERMRQSILEKVQAKQFQALAAVEDKILRKMREKEAEVEAINKKNADLEDQIKQLAMEVTAWQQRAKYNESMVTALKYNLDQVYAHQSRDNREGCGDSEVDDTASCCNGAGAGVQLNLMSRDTKNSSNLRDVSVCKVCKSNEACMLLLPCRHLCLCKECESKLGFCPLCQSSKILGMEIYM